MHDHYPAGSVRALLNTDQVTDATRQALTQRLNAPLRQPTFFTAHEFALLQAVCDRLIPQDERLKVDHIDIVGSIDKRLTEGTSNGWRYDAMPADGDAYRSGLAGIDESAIGLHGHPFQQLPDNQQDDVLKAIQAMDPPGAVWQRLPVGRFFEELLAEAVEMYYSHPLAQEEIGYVGMADVPTWQRLGLDQLEDREPRPITGEQKPA